MKSIAVVVFIYFSSVVNLSGQDQIIGLWSAKEMASSTIQVYKENNVYYGKIIQAVDSNYIGEIILRALEYIPKEGVWKGTIYSPRRKVEIDGTISLLPNGQLKLIGRKFLLTKTFYWVRK